MTPPGLGRALEFARGGLDGSMPMREAIEQVMSDLRRDGLDLLDPKRTGNLAGSRGMELAAALNRLRGLRVSQEGQ